ncbi:MAG: peptidase [Verrucomicrobiaceae bacterium]|nr:peptidase [Verrucomicrobiaceae bacterium]
MHSGFLYLTSVFALLAITFLSTSCSHLPPGNTSATGSLGSTHQLQADIQYLAGTIGERNLYHPDKLEAAAAWIETEFKHMGFNIVRRLPVKVQGKDYALSADATAFNIEAVLPGTTLGDENLVIGAHYDSKVAMPKWNAHWPPTPESPGTPGANDNASGVAAGLELARQFAGHPQARTLRFVAFVNEEPPFYQTDAMGSLAYARGLRKQGLSKVRMITPETLGCYSSRPHSKRKGAAKLLAAILDLPDRPDYVSFSGNLGSRHWVADCARRFASHSALEMRTVALPAVVKKVAWSDDWSFWQCGYPAFAVTDTAYLRSDQYHEVDDTPDKLDYQPMAQVVRALALMLKERANNPKPW